VQLNGRIAGLHKGNFQFLDKRNQMLTDKRSNARRIAHSAEKIVNDLEIVSGDIGKSVSRKIKSVLDKNSGYETLCSIS
jgi:hypothetical protein